MRDCHGCKGPVPCHAVPYRAARGGGGICRLPAMLWRAESPRAGIHARACARTHRLVTHTFPGRRPMPTPITRVPVSSLTGYAVRYWSTRSYTAGCNLGSAGKDASRAERQGHRQGVRATDGRNGKVNPRCAAELNCGPYHAPPRSEFVWVSADDCSASGAHTWEYTMLAHRRSSLECGSQISVACP